VIDLGTALFGLILIILFYKDFSNFHDSSDKDTFNAKIFFEDILLLIRNKDFLFVMIPFGIVWGLFSTLCSCIGLL